MTIEKPLWLGPHPTTGEEPEYSAQADRAILATLFTEGIGNVGAGELVVTQRAAGAAMSVEVAAGVAYVTGDDVPRQGLFRTVVTATETVPIAAAPAANSRIDLVVLRTYDAVAIGGTKHGTYLEVVQGAVAASPAVPALPPTAIALAQVLVAAGAASIVTANITDRRAQAGANGLKVNSYAQPMTTAQRDALTGADLFNGRVIDNISLGKVQVRRAGAWVNVAPDPPAGAQKAQGTYTGDQSSNRLIFVGFTPDLVLVSSNQSHFAWLHRSDNTYSQSSLLSGSVNSYRGDNLGTDGFFANVTNAAPTGLTNLNNVAYAWTAFKFV